MAEQPNKPRRRDSFKGQWDKTPAVVNVKQKFYETSTDKYTPAQKVTFTKWVNVQLHSIPLPDENYEIPEITAVDNDFRDGTRLISLLHVLYPNDPQLPKPERGKTRHHHVANVNKVLEFLETKFHESGLAALKAIGPVDIVDGNVKLTLGLLWFMISKGQQLSVPMFESDDAGSTEDMINELKESEDLLHEQQIVGEPRLITEKLSNISLESSDQLPGLTIDSSAAAQANLQSPISPVQEHIAWFESKSQDLLQKGLVALATDQNPAPKETDAQVSTSITIVASPSSTNSHSQSSSVSIGSIPDTSQHSQQASVSSSEIDDLISDSKPLISPRAVKRQTLPTTALGSLPSRKGIPQLQRFRTLQRRTVSTPLANSSSWLIFWLNIQLVDYGPDLPSGVYPIEDFSGLNNGILLAALIQNHNKEWLPDYEELVKQVETSDEETKEQKVKDRLGRCFAVLAEKMDIPIPKDLVALLATNEERTKIDVAWSIYISEIFMTITGKRNPVNLPTKLEKQDHSTITETQPLSASSSNSSFSVANFIDPLSQSESSVPTENFILRPRPQRKKPLIRQPSMAPQTSIVAAIWEWAVRWMLSDNENGDIYSDYYEIDEATGEKTLKNLSKKNSVDASTQTTIRGQRIDGHRAYQDDRECDEGFVPFQTIVDVEQPSLYMYWN